VRVSLAGSESDVLQDHASDRQPTDRILDSEHLVWRHVPGQVRVHSTGVGSACALGEDEQGAGVEHPALDIPNAKASIPVTVEHSAQPHP
jgi:hypothetical protein